MRLHRAQKGCAFLGRLTQTLYGYGRPTMNDHSHDQNDSQMPPWIRGIYVLGWSLAGAHGAVIAVKEGVWYGWGMLFCCYVFVFVAAGWPSDIFKPVVRFHQTLYLIIGLGMTLSFGGLIISMAMQ